MSQVPPPTEKDFNRILFSRKVSEVNSSAELNAMLQSSGKVDSNSRVHYNSKVLKKIFAKQILNREHMDKINSKNEKLLASMTHPVTADGDLAGASIHTDDSVSKLFRKDGSPIKNSQLKQTKGFAPSEFNKH